MALSQSDMNALREALHKAFSDVDCLRLPEPTQEELEGFVGLPASCRNNAARWCAAHPGDGEIEGWAKDSCQAAKHVIVKRKDKRYLDVTPGISRPNGTLLFVPHHEISTRPFETYPETINVTEHGLDGIWPVIDGKPEFF
ncbi:hypothetical protein [Beijerinckia mobilis]|uniref:hypothetical protein n=1 Tax=Beijerinckia mobilis TaxID=231434 RepID=UPI0012EC0B0A|nr:hypothetical protein [Beijerinckia mobilis]